MYPSGGGGVLCYVPPTGLAQRRVAWPTQTACSHVPAPHHIGGGTKCYRDSTLVHRLTTRGAKTKSNSRRWLSCSGLEDGGRGAQERAGMGAQHTRGIPGSSHHCRACSIVRYLGVDTNGICP